MYHLRYGDAGKGCFVQLPASLLSRIPKNISPCAVHIAWETERRLMVWGGRECDEGSIVLPSALAPVWQIPPLTAVTVSHIPTHSIPRAASIELEPCTADDWDVIESQATSIEHLFLSQLQAVTVDCVYPLQLKAGTVLFRVVSIQPREPNFPTQVGQSEAILDTESELHIAPRSLATQEEGAWGAVVRVTFPASHGECERMFKEACGGKGDEGEEEGEGEVWWEQRSGTVAAVSRDTLEAMELPPGALFLHLTTLPSDTDPSPPSSPSLIVRVTVLPNIPQGFICPLAPPAPTFPVPPGSRVCLSIATPASSPLRSLTLHPLPSLPFRGKSSGSPLSTDEIRERVTRWLREEGTIYCGQILFLPPVTSQDPLTHRNQAEFWFSVSPESSECSTEDRYWRVHNLQLPHVTLGAPLPSPPPIGPGWSAITHWLASHEGFVGMTLERDAAIGAMRGVLGRGGQGGCVVVGPRGAGKSSLLASVGRILAWPSHQASSHPALFVVGVSCRQLMGLKPDAVRNHLQHVASLCFQHRPSVMMLDDIDAIIAGPESDPQSAPPHTTLLARTLQSLAHAVALSRVSDPSSCVALLASCTDQSVLTSPALSRSGMISMIVNVPLLSRTDRLTIAQQQFRTHRISIGSDAQDIENLLDPLLTATEGCGARDLVQLVERVVLLCRSRNRQDSTRLTSNILSDAVKGFVPMAVQGLDLVTPSVTWADVGALEDVKASLQQALLLPTHYPRIFALSPTRPRSGALLFGPSGCGKTLMAGATAGQCGLNFLTVSGPEMLNKYIGASEKAVRDMFESAQRAAPCLLFFDEFEAICARRGADNTGVTDRVVNQFLCLMDGVEALHGVYILAATSRPDLVDPALLRPGRLDRMIPCPLPSLPDRISILSLYAQRADIPLTDTQLQQAGEHTEGYSGADLQAVVYSAQLAAVTEGLEQGVSAPQVTASHFAEAVAQSRPSLAASERRRLAAIYANFMKGPEKTSIDKRVTLR